MKGAERWAGHGPPVGLTALGQEAVQTLKPMSAPAGLRRGAGVGDQAKIMGRWDDADDFDDFAADAPPRAQPKGTAERGR